MESKVYIGKSKYRLYNIKGKQNKNKPSEKHIIPKKTYSIAFMAFLFIKFKAKDIITHMAKK